MDRRGGPAGCDEIGSVSGVGEKGEVVLGLKICALCANSSRAINATPRFRRDRSMALQGTLDTFELPDVLRLLASTKKSGRLHLQSDRGTGDVWLDEGRVTSVRSDAAGT